MYCKYKPPRSPPDVGKYRRPEQTLIDTKWPHDRFFDREREHNARLDREFKRRDDRDQDRVRGRDCGKEKFRESDGDRERCKYRDHSPERTRDTSRARELAREPESRLSPPPHRDRKPDHSSSREDPWWSSRRRADHERIQKSMRVTSDRTPIRKKTPLLSTSDSRMHWRNKQDDQAGREWRERDRIRLLSRQPITRRLTPEPSRRGSSSPPSHLPDNSDRSDRNGSNKNRTRSSDPDHTRSRLAFDSSKYRYVTVINT